MLQDNTVLKNTLLELDTIIHDNWDFVSPEIYSKWQGLRNSHDIEKIKEFINFFRTYCENPMNCA